MIRDEIDVLDDAQAAICADDSLQGSASNALFASDTGELSLDTRRALMHLLSGPFISARKHSKLWSAFLRDEKVIRSRLSELFLEIVVDPDQQIAFIKQAENPSVEVPTLLRRSPLTFIDSALILHLRRRLAQADANGERAVISTAEIIDHLTVYERATSTDRAGFSRRVNASIVKLKKNSILQLLRSTKDRYEISPTLKLLFSAAEIISLTQLYEELANSETPYLKRRTTRAADDQADEELDDDDG